MPEKSSPIQQKGDAKPWPHILVVEDDADMLDLISRHIGKWWRQACVRGVPSGNGALAVLSDFAPDLIILDLNLPGLDGLSLCRSVTNDPRLKKTKILVVTAMGNLTSREAALESGAGDFLAKPFGPKELRSAMEKMLE